MKGNSTPPPRDVSGINRKNRGVYTKPKDMRGTIHRLWDITKGKRNGFVFILVLSSLSSIASVLSPLVTGRIITSISLSSFSIALVLALCAIYFSDYIFKTLQQLLMAHVGQRIINHIRVLLFDKLLSLPLSFFDRHQHGELMSRLTNDIDSISTTITSSLSLLLSYIFSLIGILISMLLLSPTLTLTMGIPILLIFILTEIVTKRTRAMYSERQARLAEVNAIVEESIPNIAVIKSFSKEDDELEAFKKKNEELRRIATRAVICSGFLMPMMQVINNLSYLLLAILSAILYIKGYVSSIGLITSFLLYAKQFTRPFVEIANVYNNLQTAIAGAERIFQILDEEEEKDFGKLKCIANGDIELDNVSFSYDGRNNVIDGVSLKIKRGTKVAIVGETGSGKTTLISLLTRFYDVSSGRILIDGIDIREFSLESLRKAFSVVLQDSALFSKSIRENISYGKADASYEEVIKASVEAGSDSFISRLNNGYDTILYNSGSELSHGERQLITISRSFLYSSPMMILDEATSNVDTLTEKKIRSSLISISKGRTSFVIAHRLSTIKDSDLIIVLEKGHLIEQGTHNSLMEKRGMYYNLVVSQI